MRIHRDRIRSTFVSECPDCPQDDIDFVVDQIEELLTALDKIDKRALRQLTLCEMVIRTFERVVKEG